jgi:Uma2 family endonuclease
MSTALKSRITPEEYPELEREAEFKSGYYNGEMYAMAGASVARVLIATNLVREWGVQLVEFPQS